MYAPSPPPEGALAGVGVKKVPNNLNNNSHFVIYHDPHRNFDLKARNWRLLLTFRRAKVALILLL